MSVGLQPGRPLQEFLQPERRVVDWIDAQHVETLYISVLTLAERRLGVAVLPANAAVEVELVVEAA